MPGISTPRRVFVVMPFGLCNAPSTFQRLMDRVLKGLKNKNVVVYLDDVNVFSRTWEEHLKHLREVFERFRKSGLRLNIKKCFFAQPSLSFLGFIVSEKGVQTDQSKVEKMVNFPAPTNTTQLRGFLGLVGYYRQFIADFSKVAHPLNLLLRKGKSQRAL